MTTEVNQKDSDGAASVAMHAKAVESWSRQGVLCADDKHVLAAEDATELGVNLSGMAGLIGAGPQRLHQLLCVTLVLLEQRNPKLKWVQIVLGR